MRQSVRSLRAMAMVKAVISLLLVILITPGLSPAALAKGPSGDPNPSSEAPKGPPEDAGKPTDLPNDPQPTEEPDPEPTSAGSTPAPEPTPEETPDPEPTTEPEPEPSPLPEPDPSETPEGLAEGEQLEAAGLVGALAGETIQVKKIVTGTGASTTEEFDFDGAIDEDLAHNESSAAVAVSPGTYTVTEVLTAAQIAAGWAIDDIDCDDTGGPTARSEGNTTTGAITFRVGNNEDVICEVTNEFTAPAPTTGTIQVKKVVTGTGASTSEEFDFDMSAAGATDESLAHNESSAVITVAPGNYDIVETLTSTQVTDGWEVDDIDCDDSNPKGSSGSINNPDRDEGTASFDVQAGEDVICTFTNEFVGNSTGGNPGDVKVVDPSNVEITGNDPRVPCIFKLRFEGFAANQTLRYKVSTQSPTNPNGSTLFEENTINVNGAGFYLSPAIDLNSSFAGFTGDVGGDWHVKVTVDTTAPFDYGKPEGDNKHKTFWVESCTPPTPQAEVTVHKALDATGDPDNGDDFGFSVEGNAIPDLGIGDDSGSIAVGVNSFDVVETLPSGDWDLTDIDCFEAGAPAVEIGTEDVSTNNKVTLNLDDGDDVDCTFFNKYTAPAGPSAEVTIVKAFDQTGLPDNGDEFDFTVDGTSPAAAQDLGIGDSSGAITVDVDPLDIVETHPAGWDLTAIECLEGRTVVGIVDLATNKVTLDLDDGDQVTCTFTNRLEEPSGSGGGGGSNNGSIQVKQNVFGLGLAPSGLIFKLAGDPADETFHYSGSLMSDIKHNQTSGGTSVNPGTYTVTQDLTQAQIDAGWSLLSIECNDSGDPPGDASSGSGSTATFEVESNEDVECTFTNALALPAQGGTIQVEKVVAGGGSQGEDFEFSGDVTASLSGGESSSVVPVLGGTYSVEEVLSPEQIANGWSLESISCRSSDPADTSAGDVSTGTATFDVDINEDVVCTFTNSLQEPGVISVPGSPDRVKGRVIERPAHPAVRALQELPLTGVSILVTTLFGAVVLLLGAALLLVSRLRTVPGRIPGRR